jgi:hypothetical protein
MTTAISNLTAIGPVPPTRYWNGRTPEGVWGTQVERERIFEEVLLRLFRGGPAYDIQEYSELSLEMAVVLIAKAFRPPFLSVLGVIGRNGDWVPKELWPPSDSLKRVRLMLSDVGPRARCFANANETGAFFQVDPFSSNMRELLIVVYSEIQTIALYWGEPID